LTVGARPSVAQEDDPSAPGARIEIQRATFEDGRVLVDFRVVGALTDETLDLIRSGIPVKFRHRIELLGPRKFLLSPRNVFARTVLETRVEFDALTGRYELSRVTTLKKPSRKKGPPPYAEGTVSVDPEEMRRWMTEAEGVVLYDPKKQLPGADLRVSVESSIGRRYMLWVIPTRDSVTAVSAVIP
jgi:hypothetical protein